MTTSLGAPAILLIIIVAYAFFTRYPMVKSIVGAGLLVPGLIAIVYAFTMFNSFGYGFTPAWLMIASGIALVAIGLLLLQFAKRKRLLQVSQPTTTDHIDREAPSASPKAISRTFCEECGASNRAGNAYCTQCGERMPNLSLLKRKRKS